MPSQTFHVRVFIQQSWSSCWIQTTVRGIVVRHCNLGKVKVPPVQLLPQCVSAKWIYKKVYDYALVYFKYLVLTARLLPLSLADKFHPYIAPFPIERIQWSTQYSADGLDPLEPNSLAMSTFWRVVRVRGYHVDRQPLYSDHPSEWDFLILAEVNQTKLA